MINQQLVNILSQIYMRQVDRIAEQVENEKMSLLVIQRMYGAKRAQQVVDLILKRVQERITQREGL